jgi:hypothetical protein
MLLQLSKLKLTVWVVLLVLFLGFPFNFSSANKPGIVGGDSAYYEYRIRTSFATPNGNNTTVEVDRFTVNITSVDLSNPYGEIKYSERVLEFNNQTISAPPSSNSTVFFNPYVNVTYLGAIGFYPFTFIDLKQGSVNNLPVTLTITDPYGNPLTGTQYVNATIAKTASSEILINFTASSPVEHVPFTTDLAYNASNGVMVSGAILTHFGSIEKDFYYTLLKYARAAPVALFNYLVYPITVALIASGLSVVLVYRRHKRPRPTLRQRLSKKKKTF